MPPTPEAWVPSLQFRTLFALGVVPAAIVFVLAARQAKKEEFRPAENQEGVLESLRKQKPATRWTLVGTAGSWFVWDVIYYGTGIFTPVILEDIFGKDQPLFQTSLQSVLVTTMGVPGCLSAILLIQKWGSKNLNVYGFIALAVNFAVLALVWKDGSNGVKFAIFCILNFLLNFGPNLGTYVLPAICFPQEIRSTCHGISATGGKAGAMLGAFLFPVVRDGLGTRGVLWMQAGASLLGALISYHFLKNDWEYLNEEDKIATSSFVHGMDEARTLQTSTSISASGRLARNPEL